MAKLQIPNVQDDGFPVRIERSLSNYAAFEEAANKRAAVPNTPDDDTELEMAMAAMETETAYIAVTPARGLQDVVSKTRIYLERIMAHEGAHRVKSPASANDFKLLASVYQDLTRLAAQESA